MKQTAVEWFAEELNNWRIKEFGEDSIIGIPQEVFDKAKAMEKEQIIQAITKTIIGSNVIYGNEYPEVIHTAEQYYNETFKSE